jgi:hypothetical protein
MNPPSVMGGKEKYLAVTAPKWGDEAAEYGWKLFQWAKWAAPLFCFIATANIMVREGETAAGLGLAIATACLMTALGARVLVLQRKKFEAAGQTLGVPVNRRSSPPSKAPAYLAWCRRNGITPYAASERFGKRLRPDPHPPHHPPPLYLPPDVAAQVAADEHHDDRPWWWRPEDTTRAGSTSE